jgi:hypothetical protein
MEKCPKCSGDVPRTWTNKRRQIVGKCDGCRKLVSFGRPKKGSEQSDGETNPDVQKNGKVQKGAGAGGPKGGKSKAPPAPAGTGSGGGFFARLAKLLNSDVG